MKKAGGGYRQFQLGRYHTMTANLAVYQTAGCGDRHDARRRATSAPTTFA